jgi:hypothetical protein
MIPIIIPIIIPTGERVYVVLEEKTVHGTICASCGHEADIVVSVHGLLKRKLFTSDYRVKKKLVFARCTDCLGAYEVDPEYAKDVIDAYDRENPDASQKVYHVRYS